MEILFHDGEVFITSFDSFPETVFRAAEYASAMKTCNRDDYQSYIIHYMWGWILHNWLNEGNVVVSCRRSQHRLSSLCKWSQLTNWLVDLSCSHCSFGVSTSQSICAGEFYIWIPSLMVNVAFLRQEPTVLELNRVLRVLVVSGIFPHSSLLLTPSL